MVGLGFVKISGLFGGFAYFLEGWGDELTLYAEQSSRMGSSADDAAYFEVSENENS